MRTRAEARVCQLLGRSLGSGITLGSSNSTGNGGNGGSSIFWPSFSPLSIHSQPSSFPSAGGGGVIAPCSPFFHALNALSSRAPRCSPNAPKQPLNAPRDGIPTSQRSSVWRHVSDQSSNCLTSSQLRVWRERWRNRLVSVMKSSSAPCGDEMSWFVSRRSRASASSSPTALTKRSARIVTLMRFGTCSSAREWTKRVLSPGCAGTMASPVVALPIATGSKAIPLASHWPRVPRWPRRASSSSSLRLEEKRSSGPPRPNKETHRDAEMGTHPRCSVGISASGRSCSSDWEAESRVMQRGKRGV